MLVKASLKGGLEAVGELAEEKRAGHGLRLVPKISKELRISFLTTSSQQKPKTNLWLIINGLNLFQAFL